MQAIEGRGGIHHQFKGEKFQLHERVGPKGNAHNRHPIGRSLPSGRPVCRPAESTGGSEQGYEDGDSKEEHGGLHYCKFPFLFCFFVKRDAC